MAYDREKMFEIAKKLVNEKQLLFIEDLVSYLPISKTTFYEFFPVESNELNYIKEAIDKNRVDIKCGLREKWFNGDNALTQMALYKLIGTEEEYHRIAQTKQSIDLKADVKKQFVIVRTEKGGNTIGETD